MIGWLLCWLTGLPLGDEGGDGEALPQTETLLPVDEEGVGLDFEVMFQAGLDLEELLMRGLHFAQLSLQLFQCLVHILDFGHETKLGFISTQLNIRSVGASFESGLRHFEGWSLVLDRFSDDVHVLLHVVNFLLHLKSQRFGLSVPTKFGTLFVSRDLPCSSGTQSCSWHQAIPRF